MSKHPELRLVYMKPEDIQPHEMNWRRHPQAQEAALSDLLGEVGWAGALLYNEATGRLIDGHCRRKVAKTRRDEKVPVLVGNWTEDQERKILATLDPIAAMATSDADALSALLDSVTTDSPDIQALLDSLAATLPQPETKDTTDPSGGGDGFDTEVEPDGPTRTNVGELWLIGGKHRLLVGDCTDKGNVERLLGGMTSNLMVTDPPYGVEYDADWRNHAHRTDGTPIGGSAVGAVNNDHRCDWREAWALFPGDAIYCWHAGRHASTVQASLESAGFVIRCQIIWAKNQFVIGRGDYHWKHEPCWYAVREGGKSGYNGDRTQTTLWEIDKPRKSETGHSTQKPVECMSKPIENNSLAGDIVYDPFLGSGTTLIAAHRLNRVAYGMEIDCRYADVILKRAEAEGLSTEKVS